MQFDFPTPYPIIIEAGALDRLGTYMAEAGLKGSAYIISDDAVAPLYGERVRASLEAAGFRSSLFAVPSGEASKSLEVASTIYDRLAEQRAERRDTIVALGGGVIGDMGGFIAATFLRGMPYVQVPTTLQAMVDASVGGKVAVNHKIAKNLIGAFYMPQLVLMDLDVLKTLPRRELTAGWAEIVKHGLIMDEDYLSLVEQYVEQHPGDAMLMPSIEILAGSVMLKAQVVAEDPTEKGRRIILNYGHTLGHAIEATGGYGRYLHGEAISIGMQGEGRLGALLGVLEDADRVLARQEKLLVQIGLPLRGAGLDADAILNATRSDKKVQAAAVRWVLLQRAGEAVIRHGVDETLVRRVIRDLVAS